MKAVYIDEFGGPEVVKTGDLPVPEIQPDQVLVKVAAAGVNPVDWKIREGYLAAAFAHKMPVILGWDMAGTIEAMGEDVQGFGVGDEVYCYNRMETIQQGTFAEYGIAPASAVARIPKGIGFDTAATLPLASLTAWQGLIDIARLQTGETVFIDNGSGGVGGFAIQIAKSIGAKVIATAGGKNHGYLKSIGADAAIDYQKADIGNDIREFARGGVDVVLDCTGTEEVEPLFGYIRKGSGRVVTINGLEQSIPVLESCAAKYDVMARMFHVESDGVALTRIAELIEQAKIRPLPIETYRLDEAVTALQKSQEGHVRGKLALRVTD